MDKHDRNHAKALRLRRELEQAGRRWVMTTWILVEFLGGAARPPHRSVAAAFVKQLAADPDTTVLSASQTDYEAGFALYESRPDKSWSLVDCISILVCQRLGITQVFSGDHHFEQAGLMLVSPASE